MNSFLDIVASKSLNDAFVQFFPITDSNAKFHAIFSSYINICIGVVELILSIQTGADEYSMSMFGVALMCFIDICGSILVLIRWQFSSTFNSHRVGRPGRYQSVWMTLFAGGEAAGDVALVHAGGTHDRSRHVPAERKVSDVAFHRPLRSCPCSCHCHCHCICSLTLMSMALIACMYY